ncbi:MAG: biopolymer transporter ExbD [Gemmatimonadales bacterium]
MALPIRHPAGPVEKTLDVAPMIDVLLLLLLLSLLAQAFVRQRLTTRAAPVAATPESISIDNPVVLDITVAGFLINGQPVPKARLEPQLQAIYARRATKVLFVRAAGDLSPEQVGAALRVARSTEVSVTALVPTGS